MVQLQKDGKQIKASGLQLVAVSYDSVKKLSSFASAKKITFSLLADKGSKTIDAFQVRNKRTKAGSSTDGIAIPTTFVIDKQGVIHAVLAGTTTRRHSTADLLKAAKSLK